MAPERKAFILRSKPGKSCGPRKHSGNMFFFAIPVSLFHHFYAELYICIVDLTFRITTCRSLLAIAFRT